MSRYGFPVPQVLIAEGPPNIAPLIAYSPMYRIGVAPRGRHIPGVTWLDVTADGEIIRPTEDPGNAFPYPDLLIFRLGEAYAALSIASCPHHPPQWKA